MSDADPIGPVQRDVPLRPLDERHDRPPRPRTPQREHGDPGQDKPPQQRHPRDDDAQGRERGGRIDELA